MKKQKFKIGDICSGVNYGTKFAGNGMDSDYQYIIVDFDIYYSKATGMAGTPDYIVRQLDCKYNYLKVQEGALTLIKKSKEIYEIY